MSGAEANTPQGCLENQAFPPVATGASTRGAPNSGDIYIASFLSFGVGCGHKLPCESEGAEQRQGCFALARPEGRRRSSPFRGIHVSQGVFFPREGKVWIGTITVCLGMILGLSAFTATTKHNDLCIWIFRTSLPLVDGEAQEMSETPKWCAPVSSPYDLFPSPQSPHAEEIKILCIDAGFGRRPGFTFGLFTV